MSTNQLRPIYARTDKLLYRLRAAEALLGVSHTTLRAYSDTAGIKVRRANEFNDKAVPTRVFEPETIFSLAQWRRAQGYVKGPAAGPVVVAVSVVKGGTGKTTTAVEAAVHLQLMGLRVLCIDMDAQANLTQYMGYEADLTEEEAPGQGLTKDAVVTSTFLHVVNFYIGATQRGSLAPSSPPPSTDLIKKPFGEDGPHVICGDMYVSDMDTLIANSKGQREMLFRDLFAQSKKGKIPGFDISGYDVILMDCPPNMSMTSTCAIGAADIVVSPVRMDSFAIKGVARLFRDIQGMRETYPIMRPQNLILPTHYSPSIPRTSRMQLALNQYATMLSPQVISSSEDFPKSLEQYMPLTLQKPTSRGASEYRLFAEILRDKVSEVATAKAADEKGQAKKH